MIGPEAALAVCRFAHDAACLLLWGAASYLAALVPRDLARDVGQRLATFMACATLIAVLSTVLTLPVDVAAIGNGWADVADRAMVSAVLFETSVGRAWQVQSLVAILLAATLATPARIRPGATAVASGLLLASYSLTGHAAMHEGWLGVAHRLTDVTHLLTGGAWIGALVPLVWILKAIDDPRRRREAGIALRRFSTAGHAAVALVIATGVVNTLLVLGRWPIDAASPYQLLLAVKIALVLLMTALAVVNRYWLVPRMAGARAGTVRTLRSVTIAEVGLGLTVVALVSVFGLLEPA